VTKIQNRDKRIAFRELIEKRQKLNARSRYLRVQTPICLALAGCGGSGGSGGSGDNAGDAALGNDTDLTGEVAAVDARCSADNMKSWVRGSMEDYYLFYDQLPNVSAVDYESPEDFIRALRVSPFDRYSYVTDAATNTALFEEGKRFGFGMRLQRTDDSRIFFTLVEPQSPVAAAGITRSDELLAINGVTPDNFTDEFITAAFGASDETIDMTVTVKKPTSALTQDITVTKGLYDVQTVLDTKVLEHNNHRVGYLSFLSFLETSEDELTDAFATFDDENIDELVLDLRYNGGGRISVAEQLGSLIAGDAVENTTFTRFAYNDKYSSRDSSYLFRERNNSLNLPRVYVLTSPATCSASEMVINSLRPFVEVVTIGDRTCGKPYGTQSRERCGKSINALEIDLLNAANVGGYYNGIDADCPVTEDISQALGQPSETLFSAALFHIDNAQCETVFAGSPAFDEFRPLLSQ